MFINNYNKLINFFISTSIFIAWASTFELYFSYKLYDIAPNPELLLSFSFATYSVYGLNKLTDVDEDAINNPERATTINKIVNIFKFSLAFTFIFSLILGFSVNILTLPLLLFPIFMGIVYSVRLSHHLPRLKDITGVKNLIIALSWGLSLALLPVIGSPIVQLILICITFYFFFIKSFINSVLFDVRDVEGDINSGVKTIPVLLNINKTRNVLLILNSTLLPLYVFFYSLFYKYFFVVVLIIFYGYWYILYFCRDGQKIGRSLDICVDGEFIPVAIIVFILSHGIKF